MKIVVNIKQKPMNKISLWWLLLAYMIPFISYAQTTAIPDTAFEAKLVQLGIDSDGLINGQILNSDAAGVTDLDVSGPGWGNVGNIKSLVGIIAFTDLEHV